ncbi:phosphate acetyltransferase, partial [Aerococcus sp. L_4]
MDMFDSLKAKIQDKNVRVVFPEGYDERILGAVVRLKAE